MSSLSLAVQDAIFDKLSAVIVGAPVYQHVPDGTQPPVVIIGQITSQPWGGKGDPSEEMSVEIISITQGPARKPLFELMAQVKDALDGQALAAVDANVHPPIFESADDQLLGDGVTYYGTQRFLVFVSPL